VVQKACQFVAIGLTRGSFADDELKLLDDRLYPRPRDVAARERRADDRTDAAAELARHGHRLA